MRSKLFAALLATTAIFSAGAIGVSAMPSDDTPKAQPQPQPKQASDFDDAKQAIAAKDWPLAIGLLKKVTAAEPKNPEAFNLLGYATRKSGDAKGSLQYYQAALSLDPKHIGAHEYIGEAYLMLNDPAKAEEHLNKLSDLCTFDCREYKELKAAIDAYKKGQRPKS